MALTVLLGLLGPSAVEPDFGPGGILPPWFGHAGPADPLVWALVAVVLLLGTAAVAAGLAAVRRGWAPRPRRLLPAGALAVGGLLCVPPLGTTDPLNYAAYGRTAALGLNPYLLTPADLAQRGDPVGRLSLAEPWLHTPSVYGPVATATQWLASIGGGTSMLRTVWLLSLLSGAAFLATGALLFRLAGPDPARQVRSQLLWTLNPVLLWNLVAGPHVDTIGAFLLVLAFWTLRHSSLTTRSGIGSGTSLGTGLALAAATAVKLTLGILALPFAWGLRHDRRRLATTAGAGAAALAIGYGLTPQAVGNAENVGGAAADGTAWQLLDRTLLVPVLGGSGAQSAMTVLQLLAVTLLAALLLGALPPANEGDLVRLTARPALAVVMAYLLGTAYVRPWYDAIAWLLLALLERSWFDPLLLAHTALLTLVYDPGLAHPLHPSALQALVLQLAYRLVPAGQLLLLLVLVALCLRRIRTLRRSDQRHWPAPPRSVHL
ncbi:polyprenol phosphomannose-dependent alpha 1,6 mannosyltransferase MptB [Kitasatospora sp. LaBMicrA B282]|uniref:polyprenol phosphomannose-dependent alpha 1,6 mannosyltransferase MptB n=1 Tax=Kitasatospora sp. LaBMicrA B282 TaxID=3420949 RepID=UPI003D0F279B